MDPKEREPEVESPSPLFEQAARDAVAAGFMSQEGFERVMAALERSRE